ncbi:MAG: MerR family DNA-binding transcriptional regulator [Acidimicrobiia bacterium]
MHLTWRQVVRFPHGTERADRHGRRIGELAPAGLTVRTLHYYDQVGLLVASTRSGSGHRLCSDTGVDRLYRIWISGTEPASRR